MQTGTSSTSKFARFKDWATAYFYVGAASDLALGTDR